LTVLSTHGGARAMGRNWLWWWDAAVDVVVRLQSHNALLLAGGIAMYALLSIFPGLAAAVSIYGLFATPADVIQHMKVFAGILPPGVWGLLSSQMQGVAAHDHGTLTVAALVGLLVALYSARLTMSALMIATSIAFEERDRRSFVRQVSMSLVLTFGLIIGFLVMLLLGVIVPLTVQILGASTGVHLMLTLVRWAMLWGFAVLGLDVVYHYATVQRRPWQLLSWGSVIAAACWLCVSALFAVYVGTIASYDQTYGPLGAVMVLLVWFYLLSLTVVLGAEINAAVARAHDARAPRR
jgi:membrane protein